MTPEERSNALEEAMYPTLVRLIEEHIDDKGLTIEEVSEILSRTMAQLSLNVAFHVTTNYSASVQQAGHRPTREEIESVAADVSFNTIAYLISGLPQGSKDTIFEALREDKANIIVCRSSPVWHELYKPGEPLQ